MQQFHPICPAEFGFPEHIVQFNCGKALDVEVWSVSPDFFDQFFKKIDVHFGMHAANNMHFGNGLAIISLHFFQHLIDAITADVEFGRNALDTPELVELRGDGLFGAAAESAGAAPQALDDRAYLEHFGVHAALTTAVATVVKERPTNPLLAIAELLSKSK